MKEQSSENPRFSVITPVYNRRDVLHRAFESLVGQTFQDFEWIVVDDGSTDGVLPLLEHYQQIASFPVVLLTQTNQGKHIAWNNAMRAARGELCVPLDSDDLCIPETLETFERLWTSIPESERPGFSGINVLCFDPLTRDIVGDPYPSSPMDTNNLELHFKHKIRGEHWGCIRCDILRENPFPLTDQSTCVPEDLIWFKLARQYKVRCVNVALRGYFRDQNNALTKRASGHRNLYGDWLSNAALLVDYLDYVARDPILLARTAANTWRFARHAGLSRQHWSTSLGNRALLALPFLPLGEWMYRRDRVAQKSNP